jgi:hypothetical protein
LLVVASTWALRWLHPAGSSLRPQFVPLAEYHIAEKTQARRVLDFLRRVRIEKIRRVQ